MDTSDRRDDDVRTDDTVRHEKHHATTAGDEVGEAAGGITGVVTGAAIGSMAGPIGTIIGGIAGAIGGWWAGRTVADAVSAYTGPDEDFYRSHYEASDTRLADRRYEDVRPAYQLGHVAGQNPDYAGRPFEAVEPDLRRGWDSDATTTYGAWEQIRGYARDAYSRSSASQQQQPQQQQPQQGYAASSREELENAAEDADRDIDETMDVREF
jgi:hypothetical protein